MPLRRPQGPPGLPSPLGLTGGFGVLLVLFRSVAERGKVVGQRVLQLDQRVLHARRGARLGDTRGVPGKF